MKGLAYQGRRGYEFFTFRTFEKCIQGLTVPGANDSRYIFSALWYSREADIDLMWAAKFTERLPSAMFSALKISAAGATSVGK